MLRLLRQNIWLLVILGIVLLLRLPSFWEPYWYGDEQIYLAIGQAMNRGAVLYRDIWDNKPPLLYVLYAIVPTLLWAKSLATVFVLGTCAGVYKLSQSLLRHSGDPPAGGDSRISNVNDVSDSGRGPMVSDLARMTEGFSLVTTLLVGIFLSIPLLEGTIANAELFFTLPIVWAGLLIFNLKFEIFNQFKILNLKLMVIGLLMAIAFLFKVPAVFDFMGMFLALVLISFERGGLVSTTRPPLVKLWQFIVYSFILVSPIFVAFFALLIIVFAYFFLNHALKDFVIAAFSQNASYVSVDTGPLSKLSNQLFIKAFLLLLTSLTLLILFVKKLISKELLFLTLWFGFSLYGALLSGRPYMHYLLQIVPPVVIMFAYLSFWLVQNLSRRSNEHYSDSGVLTVHGLRAGTGVPRMTTSVVFVIFLFIFFYLSRMFAHAFQLPTLKYYKNFYDYISERKTWSEYASFFDANVLNSYALGKYINQHTDPDDPIFIWGDAAGVYVLSDRPAATRFIQAHHLTTIDPKNYDLIIERLKMVKPKFIIIKKPEGFAFPKFDNLVAKNYREVVVFKDLHVYKILNEKV